MNMRKTIGKVSVGLSLVALASLLAPTAAQAAMAFETGNVSCSYGYHGTVKTYSTRDIDGWAPGGTASGFLWDWGSDTWQYHSKTGTISGSWLAETSGTLNTGYTSARCS
jgi:hypothetical protein